MGNEEKIGTLALTELQGQRSNVALIQRFILRDKAGPVFESSGDRVVIGTHGSCDAKFDDQTMSRFHAEITIDGGIATIRDLGSRNGTRVDGVRVALSQLHEGATCALGALVSRSRPATRRARSSSPSATVWGA